MFSIGLNWERNSKGYKLVDGGRRFGRVIVDNGGEWIATQPFAGKFDMHYAEFAATESDDQLLKFVNKYGFLEEKRASGGGAMRFENGKLVVLDDEYYGERVSELLEAARLMRLIMHAHNKGRKYSRDIQDSLEKVLSGEEHGQFTIEPDSKLGFRFIFEATSLLNALWIQLVRKVSGHTQFKTCLQCGAWFEVGAGTAKRADSKFCNTAHRVAYSRNTLSKGK
jgi:hypothetical protein